MKAAAGARRGQLGEDRACRHLEGLGYRILERNWRCRSGEIDIVAREGDVVVFVEVKERRGASHGAGHEAVTWSKRQRILRAARLFSLARGLEGRPVRFDVISIDPAPDGQTRLRHDRNAFDAEGC